MTKVAQDQEVELSGKTPDSQPNNVDVSGVGQDGEDRTEFLIRQIETKIKQDGQAAVKKENLATFGEMIQLASGKERCMMYFGWLFAALSGVVLPAFIYMIGDVFDSFGPAQDPEETLELVRRITLVMLILAVSLLITGFLQYSLTIEAASRIAGKIRIEYLKAILRQESAWFDLINFTELSARLSKETQSIQKAIGEKYSQIIFSVCMSLSGLALGMIRGWSLALAMLGIAPIMLIGISVFGSYMGNKVKKSVAAYSQSAGYAEQAITSIKVVMAFGMEAYEQETYAQFLTRAKEIGSKMAIGTGVSLGFFIFCIYLAYAYAFLIGGVWVDKDMYNSAFDRPYQAGDTIAVFFGVLFGLFALAGASPNFAAIIEGKSAARLAFDVINRKPEINQDGEGKKDHVVEGQIELKDVSFFYPSRVDQNVLKNLNLSFELGKTTAIVGPSGSGKSTIVQLIERFYDPTEGEVLIDGVPLNRINLRDYRRQIGYVSQEPTLFNTTIRENLRYAKPEATDDEMEVALKSTNVWDIVQKMGGLDAEVGAGGGQLSGGQKQRIALARAFIKQPKLLIFDEATSALDKKNEAEVQKAIDNMKSKLGTVTTVVIAHRLSTIKQADRIVVLKKGKLVEDGTHDSLLRDKPDGVYAKLAKTQEEIDNQEDESPSKIGSTPLMMDDLQPGNEGFDTNGKLNANGGDIPIGTVVEESLNGQPIGQPPMEKTMSHMQRVKAAEAKEKAMLEKADQMLKEKDEKTNELLKDLNDEKKQGKVFSNQLSEYAKPKINIVIGVFCALVAGLIAPMFGYLFVKNMFTTMTIQYEISMAELGLWDEPVSTVLKGLLEWIIWMIVAAAIIFVAKSISAICFAFIGENITLNVRKNLYEVILRKSMGWHDQPQNASGVLTTVLSSECQTLNGVSSEGTSIMVESTGALLWGIILAFIFSWPIALTGLAITPFIIVASATAAKADKEQFFQGDDEQHQQKVKTRDQLIVGDAIQNYKVVASFGNDHLIIDEYAKLINAKISTEVSNGRRFGFSWGLSQGVQNLCFGVLYWASAEFQAKWPDHEAMQGERMYIALFCLMFGAFTAGQASQFGPDISKAKTAAAKIFKMILVPSEIDALAAEEEQKQDTSKVTGKIEFKDIWFRYPTRKEQWIFKGLNLTIQPNDNIAIVGESGQGKSTLISLLMRFYDPEFGQILIDGVDIKDYKIHELRRAMGLVMQEPTLFNYSIKENILYGKNTASNEEIQEAAAIANATEFIEDQQLSKAFDDNPKNLLEALENNYKDQVNQKIGVVKHGEFVEKMREISKKADQDGQFEAISNILDKRTDEQKGRQELHHGYQVNAGNKGNKLSGGQKQRVAIARAIIRKPKILLLDEATSALDEVSQAKVQQALERVMENRTSIVIAHRLTTVEKCNRLVVLEDGKIAEDGTFQDLMAKEGGYFANMAASMKKAEEKEKKANKQTL